MTNTVTIIAGPTASGKTAYALDLAAQQKSVIINADSMQVYQGLPILTAQPTEEEQSHAPHKLYSHFPPQESCTAAKWVDLALAEIRTALAMGKHPILVGGTGFYMKALTHGLAPIPEVPENTHVQVMQDTEENLPALYQELEDVDPELADRLNPADKARIGRGIEVYRTSGKPLSHWQAQPLKAPAPDLEFDFVVMQPDRAWLHERINARVHTMLEMGALEEVKALMVLTDDGSVPEHAGIVKAHGFKAFRAHLRGEKTLQEAIEYTQTETRQYAKRQDTWFRHQVKRGGQVRKVTCISLP